MNTDFMSLSIWIGILTILFGVLIGAFDNNFTTWFAFGFLCLVGILRAAWNWPHKNGAK